MKSKKIKSKIEYIGVTRDRCTKCSAPKGFCSHTIEKEYQQHVRDFDDTWLPTRLYAISEFEKSNIRICFKDKEIEIRNLNFEIDKLKERLKHYEWLDEKLSTLSHIQQR